MKKTIFLILLIISWFLVAPNPPAQACLITQYQKSGDNNPTTVEAALEAYLSSNVNLMGRENFDSETKELTDHNTGLDWDYAVVKCGQTYFVFKNDGTGNLFTTGRQLPQNISDITYFKRVPEPSTIMLLGIGLFGLAYCARKRFKNN